MRGPAAGPPLVLPAASSTRRWARSPTRATSTGSAATTTARGCPAPCLGEHTYEVLTDVLGLDDDEVAEVLGSGACG